MIQGYAFTNMSAMTCAPAEASCHFEKGQGQLLALDALAASTDIRKSKGRSPGFNIGNIDAAVLRRID
jgi:hypothetical protein